MPAFDAARFDDELLSAYLDDELAPGERARVEERLASDPEARQLLEQLRSVSRAMKDLPPQPLGADLRETVLRRAESATGMPLVGEAASADEARDVVARAESPRFTIGRTRRAWVWAGLTIAAGVFVMLFQPDSNQNNELPREVAVRFNEPANRPADVVPELRAAPKPTADLAKDTASPSPATVAAPTSSGIADHYGAAASEGVHRELKESMAGDNIAAAPAAPPESRGVEVRDVRRGGVGGLGGAGATAGAVSSRAAESVDQSESESADADLLIVNVNVKPEVIKDKLFNDVLKRYSIAVEKPVDQSRQVTNSDDRSSLGYAAGGRLSLSKETAATTSESEPEVDVVAVEATPEQIASCLKDMNSDRDRYLAIEVDDSPSASSRSAAKNMADAVDLKQFQCGVVPEQQKLQRSADNNFYYESPRGRVAIERGYDEENEVPQQQGAPGRAESRSSNQSRAVRLLQQSEPRDESVGESLIRQRVDAESGINADNKAKLEFARRGTIQLSDQNLDTMQVLFVLSAGVDQSPIAAPPAAEKN